LHIGYLQVKTLQFAKFGNGYRLTCEFCEERSGCLAEAGRIAQVNAGREKRP
jgi:hypothetical protein